MEYLNEDIKKLPDWNFCNKRIRVFLALAEVWIKDLTDCLIRVKWRTRLVY